MSKITCQLISHSMDAHIQQIYTGFFILYKRGLIKITQKVLKEDLIDVTRIHHLRNRDYYVRVILDNKIKLHYDTHDSWEIDKEALNEVDYYFKRSFSSSYLENLGRGREKIYPLGLNYPVYPSSLDKFALQRSINYAAPRQRKVIDLLRSLDLFNFLAFIPRVHLMESLPDYDAPPKILFMVRAWDPYDDPERPKEKVEERVYINTARANCIRALRNEFGEDFFGGFSHSDFSQKNYEDLLIENSSLSSKGAYIKLLKSYPICVATTGLHGSNGWKLAEYVAFSKAILSESLNYEVPGNFREGLNYLEFSSPEDCVKKAKQLFSDRELRNCLMINNAKYYHAYLRPDALILNTLFIALSKHFTG